MIRIMILAALLAFVSSTALAQLTISDIPDQTTNEDTQTSAIAFTVSDPGVDLNSLKLSATADNSDLVSTGNIVFGGSGSGRTVTVAPNRYQTGTAIIRVTVMDGTRSESDTFVLTVVRVIGLPPMPGLELPSAQQDTIAAETSPMKELLGSAAAGGFAVTHNRAGYNFPIGPTLVTWTAWEGEPDSSPVKAVKSGYVYVFRHGQLPVGLSLDDHATAGNHATKIARDAAGRIHMAWLDTGRPGVGDRVMYRRGLQDPASGAIQWETDPVVVADADWDSHVALAVSENAVHFAWFQTTTSRYRRLVNQSGSWSFEPLRNTLATGRAWDNGPDLAVKSDSEISVLTAGGVYAASTDGGATWTRESVPIPGGSSIKGPALALDSPGNAHVVFTAVYRGTKYSDWHYNDPNGAYWELRYIRRQAAGGWADAANVLGAFPEWRDFNADAFGDNDRDSSDGDNDAWDSLADWSDIAVDEAGNIHVVWHGPVNTHIFGNDEAFYTRRRAAGAGLWGDWEAPSSLYPKDPSSGHYFSYAPSLSTDAQTRLAVPVVFFETTPGHAGVPGDTGDEIFNSIFRVVRNGILERRARELTSMAGFGMSTWFPCAGPKIFWNADGRAWLDVLQTITTPWEVGDPFHFVIYQRYEVTGIVRNSKARAESIDFDGDGAADIAVYRPGTGMWYGLPSGSPGTYKGTQWGIPADVPVPADYDGDGRTDTAVWRPGDGYWYLLPSNSPGTYVVNQWGASTDIPVPGDYDGDGATDIAVWRPGSGTWFVLPSGSPGTYRGTQWGGVADIAVPADYDGDGKTDIAVWRPDTGAWYVLPSSIPGTYVSAQWGESDDQPVPGDYDGDGKTDKAVWRPQSGSWFILPSNAPGTYTMTQWGVPGDIPASGDYDGDGKTDIAIWRPSNGIWYILPAGSPGTFTAVQWGIDVDVPVSPLSGILSSIP